MLVVSELSEALEADRKNMHSDFDTFDKMNRNELQFNQSFYANIKDSFEDEIADTFIRLFDLCGFMKIDIERHIKLKMNYNSSRPKLHGKEF